MIRPQAERYSENEFEALPACILAQDTIFSLSACDFSILSSVHTLPVVVFCQSHLLKVNVKPLAFGGLQDPVACQIVAVVAGETRRDDATIGGIFYHSPTGCLVRQKSAREERGKETKSETG